MDRLDSLVVDHFGNDVRELVLSRGRISELNAVDNMDYLLISSRSRDYDPAQGGWVSELYDAGLSVASLERDNVAIDFRPALPCWISERLMPVPGRQFKRLVVFEPPNPAEYAAEDVWMAFQALSIFVGADAGADADIRVAMPVLSSLAGEVDFSVMLRMIFFAAASLASRARWGHINVIVPEERSNQAQMEFALLKERYFLPPTLPTNLKALVASIKAQYPDRVERAADPAMYGVTERQAYAIYHYTWNSYFYVNRALRREDVTDPEFVHFQAFIEALSSGISNLINYWPGEVVVRGVINFEGIEDIYKVSKVVREAAYTSTSWLEIPWSSDYLMQMRGQIGKHIEELSINPPEREVLFDRAMLHLVTEVEELPDAPRPVKVVTSSEVLPNTSNIRFSHI